VWERVQRARLKGRESAPAFSKELVQQSLARLASMQNPDGGYGWWPRGGSDVWMTAYVVFCLSLVGDLADPDRYKRALVFLGDRLLDRQNPDDADAMALFALEWARQPAPERAAQTLLERWKDLRLSEQARLCWVLATRKHPEAERYLRKLADQVLPAARRQLKALARSDQQDEIWYHPAATEALAFLLMATLPFDRPVLEESDRQVLISFLLQHRKGGRWHSTRDTALAVLALLLHEERVTAEADWGRLSLKLNGQERLQATLDGRDGKPVQLELGDEALQGGENRLELATQNLQPSSVSQPRHFTVTLRYHSTEERIAPLFQGLSIVRQYWRLDDRQQPTRTLGQGETIAVGDRLRVTLKVSAEKPVRYLLLEDPKLAGCEPLAKKSGPEVCQGECAHVELRADRTAIFLNTLGKEAQTLSYDLEAQLEGSFTAMPASLEPMYEGEVSASSDTFALTISARAGAKG
jgi:hypothetical protein